MAGKRTERALLVLGSVLAFAIVGLIVSGFYLKWFYRPTEALAWADIRTLHTEITAGLLVRNVHRWLGRLVELGLPIYAVVFAAAGFRRTMIVRRPLWVATLVLIIVGLVGPSIVTASTQSSTSLRRWYLVHESPAYILLPALVLALVFRPRAQPTAAPTTARPAVSGLDTGEDG